MATAESMLRKTPLAMLLPSALLAAPATVFAHGSVARFDAAPILVGCYHPSRQNTNTGVLTPAMMDAVFDSARQSPLSASTPKDHHRAHRADGEEQGT